MTRRPQLAVLAIAASVLAGGLWLLAPGAGSAAVIPACVPAGSSSAIHYTPGTTLTQGTARELRCSTEAGKTYDLTLSYTPGPTTPYDIGNYVGLQLYRDTGAAVQFLGNSVPNGLGRETLRWTSNGNETWYIKVENLAQNGAYDTSIGLTAVLPGGGEGG